MPAATIDTDVTLTRASARHVRVTPQKARRVVDLIRGKQATEAVAVLRFAPQAASEPIRKVLESAIANARRPAVLPSQPHSSHPSSGVSGYASDPKSTFVG